MADWRDFERDLKIAAGQMNGLVRELPGLVGAVVLNSIDNNFRSESFFGQAWAPRKVGKGNEGRAILVQTGRLRRSFLLETSGLTITIFTDTPYAQIHNEGGTITGTANVAEYARRVMTNSEISTPLRKDGKRDERFNKRNQKTSGGTQTVRAHTRNVNLTIPQRQFMGEHPALDNDIKTLLDKEITAIFDK